MGIQIIKRLMDSNVPFPEVGIDIGQLPFLKREKRKRFRSRNREFPSVQAPKDLGDSTVAKSKNLN